MSLFHRSDRLAVESDGGASLAGWLGAVLFLGLAFAPPVFGFVIARRMSTEQTLSREALFVRRSARTAVAAPPLFTAMGVLLFVFDLPNHDPLVWMIGWLMVLLVPLLRAPRDAAGPATTNGTPPAWLRVAHGSGAAALILLFLAGHIGNHLLGLCRAGHRCRFHLHDRDRLDARPLSDH